MSGNHQTLQKASTANWPQGSLSRPQNSITARTRLRKSEIAVQSYVHSVFLFTLG